MTYQETLDWMFAQLPMYQRQGETAFKKDLTNSLAFAAALGNPEKKFKSIHVGGTNGKGSTSHLLAAVLQEAGYKVGLYTSPHLKNFTERIRINGQEISKEKVVSFIGKNKHFLETQGLSFFEMTVGMAFATFASEEVDIAIVEVGLGGRLDSTNILRPEVSVITNIGLDHTQFLGETLPEIAFEKAGIIKKGVPVVVGEYQAVVAPVFLKRAAELEAEIVFASKNEKTYQTDLLGSYQQHNVKTAVATIAQLKGFLVAEKDLVNGFANVVRNTQLLGRWQVLGEAPKRICDTAHNKEGLQYVLAQLKKERCEKLHIVLGLVKDKDLESVLPLFPKKALYYFCKPAIPRGMEVGILQEAAAKFSLTGISFSTVSQAYNAALLAAAKNDCIYIGGSTFVVAEVL